MVCLVTVVISTLNDPLLPQCLESLSSQTFHDFKILLINDGGLDVSHLFKSYPNLNIEYYNEAKSLGLSYRLNQAISRVNTQYIARMDSDDYCLPDRLSLQLKYLSEHKYDLVGSATISRFFNSNQNSFRISKTLSDSHTIKKYLRYCSPLAHPTFFGKSLVFKTIYYNISLTYSQDYDFLARCIVHGFNIGNLDVPLLVYNSNSNKPSIKILSQMYISCAISKALRDHLDKSIDYILPKLKFNFKIYDVLVCNYRSFLLSRFKSKPLRLFLFSTYLFLALFSRLHFTFNKNNLLVRFACLSKN